MSSILNDLILSEKLDLYLTSDDKKLLSTKISQIRKEFLYPSKFHGIHHSEKVLLFSYLIGKHENLSLDELEILLDAAVYHDIGRMDETEETMHGYVSATRIEKVVTKNGIYSNHDNLEILKAICDAHSIEDARMDLTFDLHEIDESKLETYLKLAKILKDADALDRTRFQKASNAALSEKFLRFNFSKELIGLAHRVNEYYRDAISEENLQKYSKFNELEKESCLHGIGFNFPALDSILDYGILSEYAKKKKNLVTGRNFKGNNGDTWISVCVGDGEAKKLFVDTGIYFETLAPHLIKGEKSLVEARNKGLPIDSGRYSDERFAFYEIPLEQINTIGINPELLYLDISNLNYLNGSSNYETLVNNIDIYLNYLRVNFNFFPNIAKIEEIKSKFRETIVDYEKMNVSDQKRNQSAFLEKTDALKSMLSKEIARMLKEAFSKKFNQENVTVFDVITYILNSKKINYQFNNGKFVINNFEKTI